MGSPSQTGQDLWSRTIPTKAGAKWADGFPVMSPGDPRPAPRHRRAGPYRADHAARAGAGARLVRARPDLRLPRRDGTGECAYADNRGGPGSGEERFDSAEFKALVDAAGGDVAAAVQKWLVDTEDRARHTDRRPRDPSLEAPGLSGPAVSLPQDRWSAEEATRLGCGGTGRVGRVDKRGRASARRARIRFRGTVPSGHPDA